MSLENSIDYLRKSPGENSGKMSLETETIMVLVSWEGEQSYEKIAKLWYGCKSWENVSRMVVGVAAYKPELSREWLDIAITPLLGTGSQDMESGYCLGVLLGLFQLTLWLDIKSQKVPDLDSHLPKYVAELIAREEVLKRERKGPHWCPGSTVNSYESSVSKAVKAFVREQNIVNDHRLSQAKEILRQTVKKIDSLEIWNFSSYLGILYIEQIEYACLGAIPLRSRAECICQYNN